MSPSSMVLLPLRQELQLTKGGRDEGGQQGWTLYDPLRHRYFTISNDDVKLLTFWDCGTVDGLKQLMDKARLPFDLVQVQALGQFLSTHHLVRPASEEARQTLRQQVSATHAGGWQWLLQRYLGMRLPLWRPSAFLQDTLPVVRAVCGRIGLTLWLLISLAGLYLTSRQWDTFVVTFADFLTPGGILAYGAALIGLKLIHELGHAYSATHFGCRVNSMGIAVMMLMPMLYTDTSDAARLQSRGARMWIDAGGVLAESLVAGMATFAWAILPDGPGRSLAFVLATSSWIMSLTVNLNPFSRFDGYYLLADGLDTPNLQPRSLAITTWALGRLLMGPVTPCPEPLSPARLTLFVAYGIGLWLYRITLYLGMAWLTYTYCFKALGLAVLIFEIWLFLAVPILRQTRQWWSQRQGVARLRQMTLIGLLGSALLLFVVPLDRHVMAPAVLAWSQDTPVYAPEPSQVLTLHVREGQTVRRGDLLFSLASTELLVKQASASANLLDKAARLDRISADAVDRRDTQVLDGERAQTQAEVNGLQQRLDLLEVRAPADGTVVDIPPQLQAGQWVGPTRLLHGQRLDVRGYVDERETPRLQPGADARFIPDDVRRPALRLRLTQVDDAAADNISPAMLASTQGGVIAANESRPGQLTPVSAQHKVVLQPIDGEVNATYPPLMLRGEVQIRAQAESALDQTCRHVWRVLMSELRT